MLTSIRKLVTLQLLASIFLAAASTLAIAQAGSLDPTFGVNGIFSTNFTGATGVASFVALQSDGKIVAAGSSGGIDSTGAGGVVLRLNTNGTLDTTFGIGGVVNIKFGDFGSFATGLAIQTDGKIVVAGSSGLGGGDVVRLNANGSFDTTFDKTGFVELSVNAGALTLQSDGKIVLLGGGFPGGALFSQMQRFTTTGQLDTTFGTGGTAGLVFGGSAVRELSNGKLLVCSGGFTGGAIVRYKNNGALDNTFGITGQAGVVAAPGLALQSNAEIVTAGNFATATSSTGNTTGFGVMRLTASGNADGTFGTRGGVATTFPGFQSASAFPLIIQSDGDIVAGGSVSNGSGNSQTGAFALARYQSNGTLDTTFGTDGLVSTSFGNTTASINGLALQTDGKIVASGGTGTGNFVVARYLGQ